MSNDVDAGSVGDDAFELRSVERERLAVVCVPQGVGDTLEKTNELRKAVVEFSMNVRGHFHHENRPEATNRFNSSLQDGKFVAINVDLDEVEAGDALPSDESVESVDNSVAGRDKTATELRMDRAFILQRPTGIDFLLGLLGW